MMSHFVDAAAIDAHLTQSHGDAHFLIEMMNSLDGLFRRVNAKHMAAKGEETLHYLSVQLTLGVMQNMVHPARCDNGKALTMRDVVMARQRMLDGVHRPAALAVAQRVDAVAAQCGGIENLGTSLIVVGMFKHCLDILHQRFDGTLHEGIVHHDVLATEILFHDVVDAVGHACKGLLHGQSKGIGGVDERNGGEHMLGEVGQFVIAFSTRDDTARVIFGACGCQRDDINNGNGLQRGHFHGHHIPRVGIRTGCAGYGLGAVEHRTATHSKYHIDVLLLADAHTVEHAGIELGIGLNAGKFEYLFVSQQVLHLLIQSAALDASATIGQEHTLAKLSHYTLQFFSHYPFAEYQARGGLIIKIYHCFINIFEYSAAKILLFISFSYLCPNI